MVHSFVCFYHPYAFWLYCFVILIVFPPTWRLSGFRVPLTINLGPFSVSFNDLTICIPPRSLILSSSASTHISYNNNTTEMTNILINTDKKMSENRRTSENFFPLANKISSLSYKINALFLPQHGCHKSSWNTLLNDTHVCKAGYDRHGWWWIEQ